MKQFNSFRRAIAAACIVATALVMTLAGCTKVDDTLGGNLIPDNQQMKAGYLSLQLDALNPKKYVETRLFQSDSIKTSNISYGYLGTQLNDTLGLRSAGFLSQYLTYYKVDSGYFGYRPIFDSAQILLSISAYGSDTTTLQQFAIYEVTSNKYLTEKADKDTTFYFNFHPEEKNMLGEKLFTFTLGGDKGPATKAVTLTPTDLGRDYIAHLMLQKGVSSAYQANPYSLYSTDSLAQWVEEFKGLYICPDPDQPLTSRNTGTIYSTSLDATGLSVYGRNRRKEDPTLIKDTIGMVYYFYDSYAEDYGNVSVNSVKHDYTQATTRQITLADAVESNENRPENPTVYVEGLGGVVTEMTFTKEFFTELEQILEKENATNGKGFTSLAFNQVRMSIYFEGSDYDWTKIEGDVAGNLVEKMAAAPSRLGLYTNYKTLSPVSDYNYYYEKNYSVELAYGGYINRSRGCYVLNITGYAQLLWNSYLKEKKNAAESGKEFNWDNVTNRTVYIAPEAYSLYTTSYGLMQGAVSSSGSAITNNAPIRFDLTYNMIK